MTSFSEIERLIERYDTATSGLDQAVTDRIGNSIDAAYRNLERELRRLYPTWQSDGSLFAVQRRLLLMEELGDLLAVIRPEQQAEYEQLFTEALTISHESGGRLADELIRARDPGYPLQEFTTVPIEAAVAQARDGVARLYRYNDEFKSAVSGVVETGLIQGWGADKVARMLRGNEQMQGRFGLAQLKSKAETIARTEVMGSFNRASQERYERAGIEFSQWIATPSDRICNICAARHGNVYKLGEASIPAHPRCRCLWIPYNQKWAERGWTQDAAIVESHAEILEELKRAGGKPDYRPTSWEKRAGLEEAPQPVWKPGDAPPKAAARAEAGPSWKAKMTEAEAIEYTKNSVYANRVFFHGTTKKNAEGIADGGYDPNANTRTGAMFGRGLYLGGNGKKTNLMSEGLTGWAIANQYLPDRGAAIAEIRLNIKNPFKVPVSYEFSRWVEEQEKAGSLPKMRDTPKNPDGSSRWDDPEWLADRDKHRAARPGRITELLKSQGYDGVEVTDNQYYVAFDPEQIVVTEVHSRRKPTKATKDKVLDERKRLGVEPPEYEDLMWEGL